MELKPNETHVWSANLALTAEEEKEKIIFLNQDELIRANRFHFPIHRQRFIAARSTLRLILSQYLPLSPDRIVFSYTDHHKPYLKETRLTFNLSHTHDIALYAITMDHAIGIDIEKIQDTYNPSVAKRYFSVEENNALLKLSEKDRLPSFYRIWARKEAMIKAVGKGLSIPLSTFSVSLTNDLETIMLENEAWTLFSFSLFPGYQSALASNHMIKTISYWKFLDNNPTLDVVITL